MSIRDIIDGGRGNEFCGYKYSDHSSELSELRQFNIMSIFELGNRETEIDTYNLGFQAGVKGEVTNTWDWDLTFDRNTVYKNDLGVSGYGLRDEMIELIKNGDFNPFDYSSSRGSLDSAKYQPWQLSRSTNNFLELKFSGELFSTKNGAAGAAIGATL